MFFQMANSLSSSFSSLIQIIPAAINAATCAGRLMSVSELEKENALDMEKVDRILEKEYKGITIELKEVNIHYKDGENVIHRGILLRMQVRSLQSLVRRAKERQH